ncbi:sphingosine-1-phosphate phosphatase [Tieghemostelium lacteum]|uniref:Sphingosine-1-phosphate phosphatase n=1 Tax=Tieghemostelium lacteum TaxID=361077 RepID=A0A151Z8D4_TIELA|nr:sphingosine-1-phosphate phosphatase [Tieghemostelium lacteum]|eukprot:KYQ90054.1 sphingosine-1-phosphate phosphatase [Tieghemostelium lacteum]
MDYIQPTIPKGNKKSLSRKKDDTVGDLSKRILFTTTGIRNFFLQEYEREVPIVKKIQSYRNAFLDFYMGAASLLGEEIFYITSLPLSSWVFSRYLAMELTVVLSLSIGIGNMLKNTFQLPRPRGVWTNTPPQMDHGLPSTHTTSAFSISCYFFVFCYLLYPEISKDFYLSATSAFMAVTIWSLSVMISRLYNGHHTPMDVCAGLAIGISVVLSMTYKLRFVIETVVENASPIGVFFYFLYHCAVLIFHPQPKSPTPAYPETGLVSGTALGPVIAVWLTSHHLKIQPSSVFESTEFLQNCNPLISMLRSNGFILNLSRFLVGIVLTLLVKIFSKKLYYFIYRLIFSNNKESLQITPTVEAFGKLFVYFCVSFTITFLCPFVFYQLQLSIPLDSQ